MQDSRKPGDLGLMAQWRATGGVDTRHGDPMPGDDGLAASQATGLAFPYCPHVDDGLRAAHSVGYPCYADDGLAATQISRAWGNCGDDDGLEAQGPSVHGWCRHADDGLEASFPSQIHCHFADDGLKAPDNGLASFTA